MDRSRLPALIVLAMGVFVSFQVARPFAREGWMRLHHAVVPDGSSHMAYSGKRPAC
ncbi:MAG TPA: hypothetical protein VF541_22525 [Longimicrobium sp.]|jgi:hypothetical protein